MGNGNISGARLEMPQPGEIDALGLPIAKPAEFLHERNLLALADEAAALEKRNGELIVERDSKIGNLDRQLRAEILHAREAEIRREYQDRIDANVHRAGEIAALAEAARPMWSRAAELARSRFDPDPTKDATQRLAWMTRLSRASEPMLLQLGDRAVREKSVALAACVQEEIDARGSTLSDETRRALKARLHFVQTDAERIRPVLDNLAHAGRRVLAAGGGVGVNRIAAGLAKQRVANNGR